MSVQGTQSWHERLWCLFRSTYDSPTGALRANEEGVWAALALTGLVEMLRPMAQIGGLT